MGAHVPVGLRCVRQGAPGPEPCGDLVRIEPDGTALLYITGQVPFAFAGALIINPVTEEVILEPRDRSEWQIERTCAALTGG